MGICSGYVYFIPLSTNVDYLWTGITGANAEVTPDKLRHIWEEIN
jgi:hypothetical protein